MLTDIERAYLLIPKALPTSTHYINLRAALPRGAWVKLRAHVLNLAEHKCQLCDSVRKPLHAHEVWMFDFEKKTQILTNIVALCMHCHRLQHMSLFALQVSKETASAWGTLKHYNKLTTQNLSVEKLFSLANANAMKYEAIDWNVDLSERVIEDLRNRLLVKYH